MSGKAGDGAGMVENTSMTMVRIENPAFRAKKGPLMLFAAWCLALIVSFSAGAAGPPVLAKAGKGDNVVNFTTIGNNYTKVDNGTLVFMHLHPVQYKQFFVIKLKMMHPGKYPDYATHHVPNPVVFEEGMHYYQRWAITSRTMHGGKDGVTQEIMNGWKADDPMADAKHHISKVHCHHESNWCEPIMMYNMDHIKQAGYYLEVFIENVPNGIINPDYYDDHIVPFSIVVTTMHPGYTRFELGFKLFFLVATLLVMFSPYGYFPALAKTNPKELSSNHYWIAFLLCGLCWYNEPFMAFRVNSYKAADGLEKFHMFCSTSFIAFLLYYWLVMLDDVRIRAMGRSGLKSLVPCDISAVVDATGQGPVPNPFVPGSFKTAEDHVAFAVFYLPKMVLVFILWCLVFGSYTALAAYREFDPSYQPYNDSSANGKKGFLALGIAAAVFFGAYIIWMAVLLVWSGVLFCHLTESYKWLSGLTFFTIVLTLVGCFLGIAYPVPSSAFVFLGFYGMINAYVWILAVAWTPQPSGHSKLGVASDMEMASMDSADTVDFADSDTRAVI